MYTKGPTMSKESTAQDHGCDPLGAGQFRMAPSGDIVDGAERDRRLGAREMRAPIDGVFGLTWEQIEAKTGGRITRCETV